MSFIDKLASELKYVYRDDIHDRASLEANFREKFQQLNRVHLTDNEFARLLEEITDPDVFVSSKRLRERNTFFREDGTPLQYTLVNIKVTPVLSRSRKSKKTITTLISPAT